MSRPEPRCSCALILQGGGWVKKHEPACAYRIEVLVTVRKENHG